MKFVAFEDLDMSQVDLFDRLSDFEQFERQAIRRGVNVTRQGSIVSQSGLKWQCSFDYRGRNRSALIELIDFDHGSTLEFFVINSSLNISVQLELVSLSTSKTPLSATSVLEPKTLAARLLVQSMKLTRSKFNKRYKNRLHRIGKNLTGAE